MNGATRPEPFSAPSAVAAAGEIPAPRAARSGLGHGARSLARLRWQQVRAVVRLELRKGFSPRSAPGLYLLALAPVALLGLRLLVPGGNASPGETTIGFATVFLVLNLRLVIFLGCVAVFGNLIRRELLERSLHYYFLAPLRRELLVAGKYLTGVLALGGLFSASTIASFLLAYLPAGISATGRFLVQGPGLRHLAAYVLVSVLGVIGYGAVFLTLGFFARSPAIPALAFFGWESIDFLLPPFLKQLSVIHYLQSLCPVPLSEGPLALLADAPSAWVAIPGLLAFSLALLAICALRIRRMEISYTED